MSLGYRVLRELGDHEVYHNFVYCILQIISAALLLELFWSILMSEAWVLQVDGT